MRKESEMMAERHTDDWLSDEAFEAELKELLTPIAPPPDFVDRVMAALPSAAPVKTETEESVQPVVVRFPVRRFLLGFGTVAAAAALALAINLGGDSDQPQPIGPQVAGNDPVAVQPAGPVEPAAPVEPAEPAEPQPADPVVIDVPSVTQTPAPVRVQVASSSPAKADPPAPQPADPVPVPEPKAEGTEPDDTVNVEKIKLPAASYGVSTVNVLSPWLVASLEDTDIYSPSISSDGGCVTFYTMDDENLYLWRSNLHDAEEPAMIDCWPADSLEIAPSAAPVNARDMVYAPDKSIFACNTSEGLWCGSSEAEEQLWQLCILGGGEILSWSPDSSKLLFTDADGALYVGYIFEKQVMQICSQPVRDLCWGKDNTVIYTMEENGSLGLYSVLLP